MQDKVLVIGSSGQIGSELVAELRSNYGGSNVIASDIVASNQTIMDSGPFEILDVTDSNRLHEIIKKYEVTHVYLLAAILSANAEKKPKLSWDLNMQSLFNVLDLAKENSEINNLEINLFQSDLLSDVEEVDYDIIVANLPYIPTETLSSLESEVVDYEPLVALDGGVDGLLYINKLIKEIEEKGIKNLTLFLEVDTSHATTILNNLSHWKQVELEKDLVERDRYIIAKR